MDKHDRKETSPDLEGAFVAGSQSHPPAPSLFRLCSLPAVVIGIVSLMSVLFGLTLFWMDDDLQIFRKLPLASETKFLFLLGGYATVVYSMFLVGVLLSLASSAYRAIVVAAQLEPVDGSSAKSSVSLVPGPMALLAALVVCLHCANYYVALSVQEPLVPMIQGWIMQAKAVAIYGTWASFLDAARDVLHAFCQHVDQLALSHPASNNWAQQMRTMASFGNEKHDQAYAVLGGTRTAAGVLEEAGLAHIFLGNMTAVAMLLLFLFGIDLYENIVVIGISVMLAFITNAMRTADIIGNVFPIAWSNAMHVGEIVSVARPGFGPGDSPVTRK